MFWVWWKARWTGKTWRIARSVSLLAWTPYSQGSVWCGWEPGLAGVCVPSDDDISCILPCGSGTWSAPRGFFLACSTEDSIALCRCECLMSKIVTAKLVITTEVIYWAPTWRALSNLILTVAARRLLCILFYPIGNGYFDKVYKILEATWRVRGRAQLNPRSVTLTFMLLFPKVVTLHHTKDGSDYSGLNLSMYLLHLIILHRDFFLVQRRRAI